MDDFSRNSLHIIEEAQARSNKSRRRWKIAVYAIIVVDLIIAAFVIAFGYGLVNRGW